MEQCSQVWFSDKLDKFSTSLAISVGIHSIPRKPHALLVMDVYDVLSTSCWLPPLTVLVCNDNSSSNAAAVCSHSWHEYVHVVLV